MSADLMFRMTTTGDREGGASETRANGRAKLSVRASRAFGVLSAKAVGRAAVMAAALVLAGCQADEVATVSPYKTVYGGPQKSRAPVSPILVARMQTLDMDKNSPIMVRLFKKESKLEVWKQTRNGRYALLETFDICKWSGNLGPKVKEGDRQAPEGFYMITQGLMNPNSNYYLAFNTGFPNAYDRSLGRYGTNLMVHGACSSRGCYAMTDPQIEQIYALARDAFAGGQKAFQFQAYPFKMTPENIAEHYDDPNMPFWKMLKEGYDHFEVTRQVPKVDVCGRKYVFDSTPVKSGAALVPTRDCPELTMPQTLQLAVASKSKQDDVKVAALLPKVRREKQREEDAARFLMIASANPNPNQSTIVRPGLPQPIAKRPAAASVMIASAAPSSATPSSAAPASTAPAAATAAPLPAEAAVASATTVATGSARPAVAEAAIAATPAATTAATPGQVQVASADTESSGLLPPEKPGTAQADQAGDTRTAKAGILESGGTMIRGWFDGLFGKPKTPAGEGAPVLAGAAEADPAASAVAQATPAQGAPVQVLPVHPAGVATASAQPAAPVQVASLEASGASAAGLPANLSMEVLPVPRPALSGGAASAAPAVVPAVPAAAAAPAVASPALAAPVAAPAKPVAVIPTPATAAATDAMAAAPLRTSVPATTPAATPVVATQPTASQPAAAAKPVAPKPVAAKPVAAKPVAAKPAAPVASAEPAAPAAPAATAAPAASKPLVLDSANPPAKKSVFAKAFDMFGE